MSAPSRPGCRATGVCMTWCGWLISTDVGGGAMADDEPVTPTWVNNGLRRKLAGSPTVRIPALHERLDSIGTGLPAGKTATFNGDVGDHFGGLNAGTRLVVNGDAGRFCGNGMRDGVIVINGDCGAGAGHGMAGGKLLVHGTVGSKAAAAMTGGDLLVEGDVSGSLGIAMRGGRVVVAGDVHGPVGRAMRGGKLYLAGKFEKPGDLTVANAAPAERKRIQQLLEEHGIDPEGLTFKRITGGEA